MSSASPYIVERATRNDVPAILDIYNDAVLTTTATWDYDIQTLDDRLKWFDSLTSSGHPILCIRSSSLPAPSPSASQSEPLDQTSPPLLGIAWLSPFRPKQGYRLTVENSIYVHPSFHGRGLGSILLDALITEAKRMHLHVIVAGLASENKASIRLHEKKGFEEVGRMRETGRKFGRWLDLVFMQLVLEVDEGSIVD